MLSLRRLNASLQWTCLSIICCAGHAWADGPADNNPLTVRAVPPPGIELSSEQTEVFHAGLAKLKKELDELKAGDPIRRELCEVIPHAVQMTLDTGMFYSEKEISDAVELLAVAEGRAELLRQEAHPLRLLGVPEENFERRLDAPLPVVGGFRSRIDDSVQPFGLVLPANWSANSSKPLRLDVWLHGRGEKVSEAAFLQQRQRQLGEYTPADTVVLHPYGRYCNAFKFAGEIDVLEAIDRVRQLVPIDGTRITIRGFSMGGAGCWQLAVHYPDLWAAANPGAGFCETTEFLRVFQDEQIAPADYQKSLLNWYDCPGWTNNLRNVPTFAYSGELDRQKQAADVMAAAFKERGLELPHTIGAGMAHKIDDDSKVKIEQLLSQALSPERPASTRIDLTTYTLRYNQLKWLTIQGLEKHWQESRVQGEWDARAIKLKTSKVTRMSLNFPEGSYADTLSIDGQSVSIDGLARTITLQKDSLNGRWSREGNVPADAAITLSKRPGLQGPIDDAFMDRFAFVEPIAAQAATADAVATWAERELEHAQREWHRHFRGEARVLAAGEWADADLDQNLVLFGQPNSNALLAKILDRLPIEWTSDELVVNGVSYPAQTHVPVLIYPNPLSPAHYVVLNSGFTYRQYAYLNNARQVPMLPDWAVVDITQPAGSVSPGKIVAAGFFDERWQFAK